MSYSPSILTALALHRRGLSVIPVPSPRHGVTPGSPGDGKVPAIAWKQYQTERASEATIIHWWTADPSANVAIVTGSISNVVVVDGDSPEAVRQIVRQLPYTPWQVRTSKGYHFFLRHPGSPVRNRARIDIGAGRLPIDVRGDGGFVIGPGSRHASGHVYAEAGDWTVPASALPVFRLSWLATVPKSLSTVDSEPRAYTSKHATTEEAVVNRARAYLAAVPRPEIGGGSDEATFIAAGRMVRGFALSEAQAVDLLWQWAGGRPGWDRAWLAEKVQNVLRHGSEAIGGLR